MKGRTVLGLMTLVAVVFVSPDSASKAASRPRISELVEPGAGDSPVLSLIRGAHRLIRLEIYELDDSRVIAALGAAHRRHVDVRVLLEERPFGGGSYARDAYRALKSEGVSVRWANERAFTFTHEKAMVVDNRIAAIFTLNFTYSGFFANREVGIVDHDPNYAKLIGSVFASDWRRKSTGRLRLGRLVVSPLNSRRAITALIDSAHHTLFLYEEEMADGSIEAHLIHAARRHVKVRLITSDNSAGVARLQGHGVKVAIQRSPYVHAKVIMVDGTRMFVGSENISSTSLDRNREMGIILARERLVGTAEAIFSRDWKNDTGGSMPGHVGHMPVAVSAHPETVVRGHLLTIAAATRAAAACTIKVTYPDGYVSHARALEGTRTANGQGRIRWSWRVGSTALGTAHAGVTCRLGSKSGAGKAAFQIVAS